MVKTGGSTTTTYMHVYPYNVLKLSTKMEFDKPSSFKAYFMGENKRIPSDKFSRFSYTF